MSYVGSSEWVNFKKAGVLHYLVGYLKATVESDSRAEYRRYAVELLRVIEEEAARNAISDELEINEEYSLSEILERYAKT